MASSRDHLVLLAHGLQVIFALAVLAIGLYKINHRHALIWFERILDHRSIGKIFSNRDIPIVHKSHLGLVVKSCDGLDCTLSGVVVGLGAVLSISGTIMAIYFIRVWNRSRHENHNTKFATTSENAGPKLEFSSVSPNASKMGVRKA